MKEIFIELSNSSRSYFAGQVVEGRVVVHLDKPLKVKEIKVVLEGTGWVRWSETQSYTVHETRTVNGQSQTTPRTHTRVVTFSAAETYISQKINLAGDGHNSITLEKGSMAYPFQFILPRNAPSSFHSGTGLVSYNVQAELKRSALKINKKTCLPFTVNGIFDLNVEFGATQPQQIQKVKGSNFFACRKGQLSFELKLPRRSGFVPGEILEFSASVTNGSNRKITVMKASLNQMTQYYAQGKTKRETKIVSEVGGPEVEKGEHEMWMPQSFTIPPLPPTRLGGMCRIIDLQYCIHFEVKIAGLSTSLDGELPVMIGTIPLRSTFDELRLVSQPQIPATHFSPPPPPPPQGPDMGFHMPVPGTSSQTAHYGPPGNPSSFVEEKYPSPSNQGFTVPSAPILTDYPDLPPPSYAEAMQSENFTWDHDGSSKDQVDGNGKNDIENTSMPSAPTMTEYVPNYVTYNHNRF